MDKKLLRRVRVFLHKRPPLATPYTSAVVLAGGSGSRMGAEIPKQYLSLLGKPVLVHTLLAFEACRLIREIVLVTRAGDVEYCRTLCQQYGIKKCKTIVTGGEQRVDSARTGVMHTDPACEYVAIHDAARCLITPKQIREVANAAYAYQAATAATPAVDTIKRANAYGFIEETLPRETAWCAQTPQIFHRAYYLGALEKAKKEQKSFTDDNMLMELIGQRVFLVDTGADNFKITVASDLARAEAVLCEREKEKKK